MRWPRVEAMCIGSSWSALAGASPERVQGGLRLGAQLLLDAGGGGREEPLDTQVLTCVIADHLRPQKERTWTALKLPISL